MKKPFASFFKASLQRKHEVAIMYFGRVSEFLLMTSEGMVIPCGICTLEQVMNKLRMRGKRWAYELDDSCILCTVNGKVAMLSDTVSVGVEIEIYSNKSLFEM